MDEKQALDILIQGVEIGQKKGAFELKDSALIFNAVTVAKERIEFLKKEEAEKVKKQIEEKKE